MFVRILFLCMTVGGLMEAYHHCADPSARKGKWIGADQECTSLVEINCDLEWTSTWRKGVYVRDNCGNIPRMTAMATFLGPNGHYDEPNFHQHAAICEANGIRVWDQWNGTPIGSRVIPWTRGSKPQYGNQFLDN